MPRPLTSRQREVLQAVVDWITLEGCSPTVRELCDLFGIASPNGIACHLRHLRAKGYLEPAAPGAKSRMIKVAGLRLVPVAEGEAGRRLAEALGRGQAA